MKPILKAVIATIFVWVLFDFFDLFPTVGDPMVQVFNSKNKRSLSISYGDGTCKWQPPAYDVPDEIDFYKTMVVGYPSGDKRLTFVQMEALTGWPAKDEWDFKYLGMSNHPFIKANYPHHEGVWGWGDVGDQVVMVVRNIRRSMVEYHDILWDIGFAKTWHDAFERIPNLYQKRPPLEDFLEWRDLRILDEVHWYGWFIDYWMEEGLLRDIFTHNLTTPEHWDMLMLPTHYSRDEQEAAYIPTDIRSYDPHCVYDVSGGCLPVKIISAERLVQTNNGFNETRRIAEVLLNHEGMAEWVIEEKAWDCIWTELIINKKGLKTFIDRPLGEYDYKFSEEMLEAMIMELDRLIDKYSSGDWIVLEIASDLVHLLGQHRAMIQKELDEILNGNMEFNEFDFLGTLERRKRRAQKVSSIDRSLVTEDQELNNSEQQQSETKEDHSEYFRKLEVYLAERRQDIIHKDVIAGEEDRRRRRAMVAERKSLDEE